MAYGYVVASNVCPLLCSVTIIRMAYVVIDDMYLIYVEMYVPLTAREVTSALRVDGACRHWTVNWAGALKHCKRHGIVHDSVANHVPSVATERCKPIPMWR
jgi:hypothetical protein